MKNDQLEDKAEMGPLILAAFSEASGPSGESLTQALEQYDELIAWVYDAGLSNGLSSAASLLKPLLEPSTKFNVHPARAAIISKMVAALEREAAEREAINKKRIESIQSTLRQIRERQSQLEQPQKPEMENTGATEYRKSEEPFI